MVGDGPSYYEGDSSQRSTWMFFTTIKRDITKDLAESTETFWCVPPYTPILCSIVLHRLWISSNRFLSSARGGIKKESKCREMATDLSKFLKFTKEADLDITACSRQHEVHRLVRSPPSGEKAGPQRDHIQVECHQLWTEVPLVLVSNANMRCICSLTVYHSMPDELTEEDERLSAKANVATVKASFLKKGLARQKNLLAEKKRR